MADLDDVRRIVADLPETTLEESGGAQLIAKFRGRQSMAWTWLERPAPKAARVPNPTVLAVRVSGRAEKEELLAAEPEVFFTEPHYDGYPAVLVRLGAIDVEELRELVTDAWRLRAPKKLQRLLDA